MKKYRRKNKFTITGMSIAIFLVFTIMIGAAISFVRPQRISINQVSSSLSNLGKCTAKSNDELRTCFDRAQKKEISLITIDGTIICSKSNPCNYSVSNLSGSPLIIQNAKPGSGFLRTDDPSQWIIRFIRGDKVVIQNLTFRDESHPECHTIADSDKANVNMCAEALLFQDYKEIMVNNVTMENINKYGILVYAFNVQPHYTIQNSRFKNIGLHAIHTLYKGSLSQGGTAKILNNNFDNIRSSAFNLNINSSKDNPSLVSGNIVNKTHHTGMYACKGDNCGNQTVHDGGQVFVYSPYLWDNSSTTQNVILEKNYIANGVTASGIRVWGIEILALNVSNITIRNNIFFNNNAGIMINPNRSEGTFRTNNIELTDNIFSKNRELIKTFPFNIAPKVSGNITNIPESQIFNKFLETRPSNP